MPYIGQGLEQGRRQLYTFTATASQTTFSASYTPGYVDVFQNGILLAPGDYTATNGTSIVLGVGAAVNDEITIIAQHLFSIADTVSASSGGTFSGDISVTGNLGIGTNSPSKKLHIKDSIPDIRLEDTNTNAVAELRGNTGTGSFVIATDVNNAISNSKIIFQVDNDEKVRIDNNGNVGIGTDNPSEKLHVLGDVLISSGTSGDAKLIIESDTDNNDENDNPEILFKQDGGWETGGIRMANNQTVIWNSIQDSFNGGIEFKTGTVSGYANVTTKMTIEQSGQVGIGTTSPDRALHIEGSDFSSSTIRLKRTSGGTNNDPGLQFTSAAGANDGYGMGGIWFQNSLDGNAYALMRARTDDSTGTSGRFEFMTNTAGNPVNNFTTPRMTIHNDGAVSMPSQPVGYRRNTHTTNGWVTLTNTAHNIFSNYYTPSAYQQHTTADTIDNSGRYYAPQAGWYLVNPEIYSTTGSNETGSYGYLNVYKNGSNQFGGHIINYGGDTNDKMNSNSVIVYMTDTDYIQIGVYVAGNGTFQVYSPYCGYWVRFLG